MGRPLRYDPPGSIHHITSRGVDRCDIVRDDADRAAFAPLLAQIVAQRHWILHSWVLMTNHLHLVVETPVSNLSDGMRDLLSAWASRFNKLHRRVGHL
ncbi:MAG: transposase, partial [Thermoanaerobaculia bacterium]